MRKLIGLVVILVASQSPAAEFEMANLETEDLNLLYFDPPQTYLTPHVARSFHNSLQFQKEIFEWEPYDRTNVLLKDFSDYGNAAARASPNNALMIDIAPLSRAFETFTASERVFALMNHEMVHVATMDVWNQQDARWRKFFQGKPMPLEKHPESIWYNYLATPRVNVPRWYLEGSAVFMETWMSGGLGRAQGAYDEMVFRAMVRDGAHFYGPLGLVSEGIHADFQVGVNAYLYGTRFMSFMALTRSPDQVVEWLKRGEDSEGYYSKQFQHVFGLQLESAWDEWIAWEHEFQKENLKKVEQYPLTPSDSLSPKSLGSVSRAFASADGSSLLGAFRYPGVLAHIGSLAEDGTVRQLADIKGPMLYRVSSTAYDPDRRKIFYTADNYSLRDLMVVDEVTAETELLIKDARIGDLVVNPADKTLWGIRHLNGYVTLVELLAPYKEWRQIFTFDYGEILYDLDISPDGQYLSASMGDVSGNQFLRIFSLDQLKKEDTTPYREFNFGQAVPEGFVFSGDGRFVYGSSYYTGVSNIFRFEVETGEMEAVSNAATGYFRPVPLADGKLVVFEYTGQGFKPVKIDPLPLEDLGTVEFLGARVAAEHEVVRGWQVGSPADIPIDNLITRRDTYRPLTELGLESAYPIVESYKNEASLGWHFNFADPMQFNRLYVTGSVTPGDQLSSTERKHLSVDFEAISWYLRYRHNGADFYDLFGPIERSRKGNAYIAGYHSSLIYDRPRQLDLGIEVAHFRGLDTLPTEQNVAATFDTLTSAEVSLNFSHTRKSLGAIDHEQGYAWDLVLGADHANSDTFSKLRGGVDVGFSLPVRHSSIWFYSDLGVASGNRASPLSSYYFGSFGNNYVDMGEVKRYRQHNSFPGFDINELKARRFFKNVAEWNVPPVRFEEVGIPSFYLTSLRPAMFIGTLYSDPDDGTSSKTLNNFGFQVDLSFTIAHRLPMTLSVGYAVGYQKGNRRGDEFMASLKIL